MRNLLVANGGMKLYGDDFDFLQRGVADSTTAIIKRFADARMGKRRLSG